MKINIPDEYIEISSTKAFTLLCKKLHMDSVLNEDGLYEVRPEYKYPAEGNKLWKDGEIIDERGDLFIALRNVAVQLYPNLLFRNADYIYGK